MKSKPDWSGAVLTGVALTLAIVFFFVLGLFKTANATHEHAFSWANFYEALPISILIIGGFLVAAYLASRRKAGVVQ